MELASEVIQRSLYLTSVITREPNGATTAKAFGASGNHVPDFNPDFAITAWTIDFCRQILHFYDSICERC